MKNTFIAADDLLLDSFRLSRQAQAFAPIYIRWLKQKPSDSGGSDPTSVS
jgi:hypothetical protein